MTQDPKAVVTEFFIRFSDRDLEGALALMSDDCTWWIAGKSAQSRVAGTHTKDEIAAIFRRMDRRLKSGLELRVKGMIAEDSTVAVELESYGEVENGRVYNNEYHTLLVVRDGLIREVREYLDTHHLSHTWFED